MLPGYDLFFVGDNKLPVACFDIECQLCERGHPRKECTKLNGEGNMWKHLVDLCPLYYCDEKMFKEMLLLKMANADIARWHLLLQHMTFAQT